MPSCDGVDVPGAEHARIGFVRLGRNVTYSGWQPQSCAPVVTLLLMVGGLPLTTKVKSSACQMETQLFLVGVVPQLETGHKRSNDEDLVLRKLQHQERE